MNKSFPKPTILIVSSSSTKPKSLIKLITGATNISNEKEENYVTHPWKIDTKYYTAEADIYGITEHFVRTDKFNGTVEALIIHMDSNRESGLEDLERWSPIETDCDPDIKLLICNYCTSETKITKAKAIEWCLKHGYELIELYPNISKCNDSMQDDEIIKEKTGVDRIVEALQTHVWSNLIMKSKSENENGKISKEKSNVTDSSSASLLESSSLTDDSMFGNFLTSEGTDDFTELFSQLHMIKESMKSMPTDQRKQCAEQMVTAFWHAIGGDEEEISDL